MTPKHILKGMIPKPNFPNHIEDLTRALAKKLGIKRSEFNYSIDSLSRIEKILRRLYPPKERDQPELFLPFIAYVSEVGRLEMNGFWEMRLAEDGETWEPWVVGPHGNNCEFFTLIYKELCGLTDESGSVVGALLGTIRSHCFNRFIEKAESYPRWLNPGK